VNASRRKFLGFAACLPAARFASGTLKNSAGARQCESGLTAHCLLLNFSCSLSESFEGYRVFLKASGTAFELVPHAIAERARVILVPATAMADLNQARWLRNHIEQGSTAVVESGGAFLSRPKFYLHKWLLSSQFGLEVAAPVDLWRNRERLYRPPYVDFTWPVGARVRDFSRIVPVLATSREAIALQDGQIIGLKRRIGAGTLVFLGSPVGPHLLAGDREAGRWLQRFL
jgi:hypothetical protein